MPIDVAASTKPQKSKKISIPRARFSIEHEPLFSAAQPRNYYEGESLLPPLLKSKLHDLFLQIEREFEVIYSENLNLQEKVDVLNERLQEKEAYSDRQLEFDSLENSSNRNVSSKTKAGLQKVKTAHKLKAQTSKIVSSFKGPTLNCSIVRAFKGHKDGIWDVAVARPGQPLVGTASADHTACVWGVDSGRCLLQYQGHTGSVNSIRFHPSKDLVLTASGDQTAHVWQAVVTWESQKLHSSEEELGSCDKDDTDEPKSPALRTPVKELLGHTAVISAADWMPGGDQVVTASWDRTACLFDLETGDLLQSLGGHDMDLTHASAHPVQSLVVTSSKDTTFRLWDFRDPIHSVSVFQGHTETVTSAVFTKEDKVVSGSDDRSVKVWDLRNMRSPFATITADSAINRLAVSTSGVIAIPHDNRQVRLFDLTGQRLVRLPRSSRQGHRRMVSSVAWADESTGQPCNLFSCGFDRMLLGWSIQPANKDS